MYTMALVHSGVLGPGVLSKSVYNVSCLGLFLFIKNWLTVLLWALLNVKPQLYQCLKLLRKYMLEGKCSVFK